MSSIPPVREGCKRQWVECTHCGNVAYYDYVPFSLSNPVMTLPCNHSFEHNAKRVGEEYALKQLDKPTFQREERYIVVKLKDVGQVALKGLRYYIENAGIPTRECVVVEPDHPHYEETWENVQRSTEGKPTIAQELATCRQELSLVEWGRDGLLAKVDLLERRLEAAQALADAELVDHSQHIGEDGRPCQFANEKTWHSKWARDLHMALNNKEDK